jgi:uncharacterized protein YqgC (DUF456 family)
MEIVIYIIAILLGIGGIFASPFPGPGPLIGYAGMLLIQWQLKFYSNITMWVFAGVLAFVFVLDYLLPLWFGKRFGASKTGSWGSVIGMLAGMFIIPPIGMMTGLLIGAIVGELIAGRTSKEAVKAGIGTYIGAWLTNVIKVGAAGLIFLFICAAPFGKLLQFLT